MTDALVPETFATPVPEAPIDEELTKEEYDVASLANHPGWKRVKADLEQRISEYRTIKFEDSLSNDEVGKRYRIACEVADTLQTILKHVERTYEHLSE